MIDQSMWRISCCRFEQPRNPRFFPDVIFLNYWGGKMAEIQLRISVALFVPSAHFGPAPRREIRDQGMIMPVTIEARRMRPMPG
jgi:hypothetical protein